MQKEHDMIKITRVPNTIKYSKRVKEHFVQQAQFLSFNNRVVFALARPSPGFY
jgi:hypothetical protein